MPAVGWKQRDRPTPLQTANSLSAGVHGRGLLPTLARQKTVTQSLFVDQKSPQGGVPAPQPAGNQNPAIPSYPATFSSRLRRGTKSGARSASTHRKMRFKDRRRPRSAVEWKSCPQQAGRNARSRPESIPQRGGTISADGWRTCPQPNGKAPQPAGNLPAAGWKRVLCKWCILCYLVTA